VSPSRAWLARRFCDVYSLIGLFTCQLTNCEPAFGTGEIRGPDIGLRRTFNDLVRATQAEGVVTKSISGHVTDRMRERCSTVAPLEQRTSIAKVIDFAQARRPAEGGEHAAQSGEHKEKAGGLD
jgi:hypothetical protein